VSRVTDWTERTTGTRPWSATEPSDGGALS
jgi:hypothetical protein